MTIRVVQRAIISNLNTDVKALVDYLNATIANDWMKMKIRK
jgi:hypothetical protein